MISIASDLLETRLPARPKTTLNIGLMQGGRSINSIASSAEFEFELRSESEEVLLDYASTIHRKIEDRGSDTTRVRIESAGIRPAGSIPSSHPLVSAAIFSLKEAGVRDPVLQCGSTDANLPLSRGLPAICIGLTTGGDAHTTMEYIEIEPINTGFNALLNLIHMIAKEDWLLAG
jgi:acetylornithine deacetylase/succinyl-diaminopimelate desuccinylase-like protein